MVKLLTESDKPSEKTDLGVSIHVYTDNGEIKGVWSNSPLGVSEYTETGFWKAVSPRDPRILELQDYSVYKLDWSNDNDFDEDGESKTLELYAKGQLTENHLKKNTIFLRDPIKEEQ